MPYRLRGTNKQIPDNLVSLLRSLPKSTSLSNSADPEERKSEEKEHYETLKIKQELRHNKIKLWFTLISALAVLAGFGLDRLKTIEDRKITEDREKKQRDYETHALLEQQRFQADQDRSQREANDLRLFNQRKYDAAKEREQRDYALQTQLRKERIARMTEIATNFDQMLSSTLDVLNQDLLNIVAMKPVLETIKDKLDKIPNRSNEIDDIQKELDRISKEFSETPAPIAVYANVATLQEQWLTKRNALAPDFETVFSPQLASEWKSLAELAWNALNIKYNPFSSKVEPSLEELTKPVRDRGAEFQTHMRKEILLQRKSNQFSTLESQR